MASLDITEGCIPHQAGKIAIITGGASGIGLATAHLLARKGAFVHILDLNGPDEPLDIEAICFHKCDVSDWNELRQLFEDIGEVDYAFANAGITETSDFFAHVADDDGNLAEPTFNVFDVNVRAVFYFVKLAWNNMRKHNKSGSIVITSSAVAYGPEHSLPVYSSSKLATLGLIRSLRPVLPREGITINGVAPSMTVTKLLPEYLATPMKTLGLPVSDVSVVGLAMVYSAVAMQKRRVEAYGKEKEVDKWVEERWNGRVILALGDKFSELEEPLADLRQFWFGSDNHHLARLQQAATDVRESRS